MFALWNMSEHPDVAAAIVNANLHHHISQLLDSTYAEVRKWSCMMLGRLAAADDGINVHPGAIRTLGALSEKPKGEILVDADALTRVPALLQSGEPCDLMWTCKLIGNLAGHDSTGKAVLDINPCPQLVLIIQSYSNDIDVSSSAIYALAMISQRPDGGQMVSNADVMECVPKLLDSADAPARAWTCTMLGHLAGHELLSLVGLALDLPRSLVSLLSDGDVAVRRYSIYALCKIGQSADGLRAVMEAEVGNHVLRFLVSRDSETQEWTCMMLGQLALNTGTSVLVLGYKACSRLVSLLPSGSMRCRRNAMFALSKITEWHPTAAEAVKANVLGLYRLTDCLYSPDDEIRKLTCQMLGRLASHRTTLGAVMNLSLVFPLLFLLRDDAAETVRASAVFALARMCQSRKRVARTVRRRILYLTRARQTTAGSRCEGEHVFTVGVLGSVRQATRARAKTCIITPLQDM
ncbi:armadillo-type protein [Mycena polygramma]|nr:armadillo-type protein [Mycena polygramma]